MRSVIARSHTGARPGSLITALRELRSLKENGPPEEHKLPVRHTDLPKLEGDPSPEAEHAYFLPRSDVEFERTRDGFKIRANFAGDELSPVNMALAYTIDLAAAGGVGALANYLGASTTWVIGLAVGSLIIGTGLIIGAMRLLPTRQGKRK
jgi:hypothetical protein